MPTNKAYINERHVEIPESKDNCGNFLPKSFNVKFASVPIAKLQLLNFTDCWSWLQANRRWTLFSEGWWNCSEVCCPADLLCMSVVQQLLCCQTYTAYTVVFRFLRLYLIYSRRSICLRQSCLLWTKKCRSSANFQLGLVDIFYPTFCARIVLCGFMFPQRQF